MDPEAQEKIDSLIYETNAKLEAIVAEMKAIRFSDLDDVKKREKTDSLRGEFEKILNEQQKKVEKIKDKYGVFEPKYRRKEETVKSYSDLRPAVDSSLHGTRKGASQPMQGAKRTVMATLLSHH